MSLEIKVGDAIEQLRTIPDRTFRCVVTSPPYWNLRNYQVDGQIGMERTPEAFIDKLVAVFNEVKRVLTDDGTLWLNMGDSYAGASGGYQGKHGQRKSRTFTARIANSKIVGDLKPKDMVGIPWALANALRAGTYACDRCGMTLRADQWPVWHGDYVCIDCCRRNLTSNVVKISNGWYLRSDIIWYKLNPMPESTKDRPTKSYEHVFLFSKSRRYYYNGDAIREPRVQEEDANGFRGGAYTHDESQSDNSAGGKRKSRGNRVRRPAGWSTHGDKRAMDWNIPGNRLRAREAGQAPVDQPDDKQAGHGQRYKGFNARWDAGEAKKAAGTGVGWFRASQNAAVPQADKAERVKAAEVRDTKNKRDVWPMATQPSPLPHFATFPEMLVQPCILAGSDIGDRVLDPFGGTGTTALVALNFGRKATLIELNPKYARMADVRCSGFTPGLL